MSEYIDGLVVANEETDNRYPLKAGENLKRGRVLKLENGKLVGAMTGDEPCAILLDDTDATAGDTKCSYYTYGRFDADFMDFGDGTEEEFREKFRKVGIRTVVPR